MLCIFVILGTEEAILYSRMGRRFWKQLEVIDISVYICMNFLTIGKAFAYWPILAAVRCQAL